MNKIKIAIVGYGNLGRGVEASIRQNPDMELVGVFSRRDPKTIKLETEGVEAYYLSEASNFVGKIDVMILCGGSATDLPEQCPEFAKLFNTVDSYDNHGKIPEYFERVNKEAEASGKIAVISVGWDPGLFSINRMLAEAVLPVGETYTFWGKGLSQGHSDAIRRVEGVKNGVQYTIPKEEAIEKVRNGINPSLSTREKHLRVCYVVLENENAKEKVEESIKNMPNYFADYDTEVNFISEDELLKNHSAMPHGGFVIRSGETGKDKNKEIIEFSLKLDSNPEFTSSVLVAYARAAYKLSKAGEMGAKTVFDIPLGYLSSKSPEELRKNLL